MLNLNVGLLGHVDSGKTSLAKALSQTASTAAFDKSPQSQSRGITLDLGFSACEVTPQTPGCAELLAAASLDKVVCTLVDCPGHASLLRTVVGGAQIMDVMVLLIDATKGIQTQTAECMVLGEVLAKPLVVVINKVDAIQGNTDDDKKTALGKLKKRLLAAFAKTRWPQVPMVEVSANPKDAAGPQHTSDVLAAVLAVADVKELKRRRELGDGSGDEVLSEKQKFMMLVDHCFAVRGHGTVFTGTVLGGLIAVGDTVLIPERQETRKVKSLQVFKAPVNQAKTGDRVGLCVAQFDPAQMERGVLCGVVERTSTRAGGTAATDNPCASRPLEKTDCLLARVHKVRFHSLPCDSHTKYHVTIGHTTVMGTMRYFSRPGGGTPSSSPSSSSSSSFDLEQESLYEEELGEEASLKYDASASLPPGQPLPEAPTAKEFFGVLLLEQPVFTSVHAAFVAMRLDVERENLCRLAVSGTVVALLSPANVTVAATGQPAWRSLPVVRLKHRPLRVDRVVDARTCIAQGVVLANVNNTVDAGDGSSAAGKKDKNTMHAEAQRFVGLSVRFIPAPPQCGPAGSLEPNCTEAPSSREDAEGEAPVEGTIVATFGKTGNVKLCFKEDVFAVATERRASLKKDTAGASRHEPVFLRDGEIVLPLKKYPFALHSGIRQ